jgi:acyl-coenzyme A thioesterase 9
MNLILRRMADSRMREILPLCSDAATRLAYTNHSGALSFSRLLEDLDAAAGYIAYLHCGHNLIEGEVTPNGILSLLRGRRSSSSINTEPNSNVDAYCSSKTDLIKQSRPVIVTASLDRLTLSRRPTLYNDTVVSGNVTHVGSSSMEVTLRLFDALSNTSKVHSPTLSFEQLNASKFCTARFTMVARDGATREAVQVSPLLLDSAEEKRIFSRASDRKVRKLLARDAALTRSPPTPEERLIIHDLWLRRKYPNNDFICMGDTVRETIHTMEPQDRNMHNFIFGGYLMRLACDLAMTTGTLYARSKKVQFLGMDDINFRKPVEIGSVVALRACVSYTSSTGRSFLVRVTADVIEPASGARDTTNVFHILFSIGGTESKILPQLLPRTYGESMQYLDAKRRWEAAKVEALDANAATLNTNEW